MDQRDPVHGLTVDEMEACDRLFGLLTQEIVEADDVREIERRARPALRVVDARPEQSRAPTRA